MKFPNDPASPVSITIDPDVPAKENHHFFSPSLMMFAIWKTVIIGLVASFYLITLLVAWAEIYRWCYINTCIHPGLDNSNFVLLVVLNSLSSFMAVTCLGVTLSIRPLIRFYSTQSPTIGLRVIFVLASINIIVIVSGLILAIIIWTLPSHPVHLPNGVLLECNSTISSYLHNGVVFLPNLSSIVLVVCAAVYFHIILMYEKYPLKCHVYPTINAV